MNYCSHGNKINEPCRECCVEVESATLRRQIAERYHERLVESLRDFAERPEWYEYEGRVEGSIYVDIDVMNKARELLAEIAKEKP